MEHTEIMKKNLLMKKQKHAEKVLNIVRNINNKANSKKRNNF